MNKNFENKSFFSNPPAYSFTCAEKLNYTELKVLITKKFLITEIIHLYLNTPPFKALWSKNNSVGFL